MLMFSQWSERHIKKMFVLKIIMHFNDIITV